MKALLFTSCLLLLACTQTPSEPLHRKPIAPASANGWARLPLDREAQNAFPELWLSDAQGRRIPYLVERDGLWQPRDLDLQNLAMGKDAAGHPTAEFTLKFPQGWQVREREQLRIHLDLEGTAPWVCRAGVERRLEGGRGITLEREVPLHVFDLGYAGHQTSLSVPWDFKIYRITLHPVQGAPPRIRGLRVVATTEPSAKPEDAALNPRVEALGQGEWNLSLEGPDRIVGAEILLSPPVAPIAPIFFRRVALEPGERDSAAHRERMIPSTGLLWNLPALATTSTRVSLEPTTTDSVRLRLPDGVTPESVKLLVRRDVLLFPAEARQAYFLHLGGVVQHAPGNLGALPDSSRGVYQREALTLGAADTDPQGIPRVRAPMEKARPWLPWVAGFAVVVLGFMAWKLFQNEPSA